MMDRRFLLGGLAAASLTLGLAGTASAGPLFDSTIANCSSENCSSVVTGASLLAFGGSLPLPWVGQVFASSGQCLRLDVIAQGGNDLEIVAVSPDGGTFRNDDRNGAQDRRPLVKINGTDPGWYTVQVSRFNGAAVDADFTLAFGRYGLNNANCANPTTTNSVVAAQAKASR